MEDPPAVDTVLHVTSVPPRAGLAWQPLAIRAGFLAVILLLWWVLATLRVVNSSILASPAAVFAAEKASATAIARQFGATIRQTAIALGIAWVGGLTLGLVLGTLRTVRPLLGLARSAYAVPIVIVYPILTVWFGYGTMSKVVFGAFAGVIPMLLMTASAVSTIDPKIIKVFASLGASRRTVIRSAVFPASLPGILGALRLSGSLVFVSVVVGEMLVSTQGLGYWIANSAGSYKTSDVYLGICWVIVLAILLHAFIGGIQKFCSSDWIRNRL